jgi:hypothetical protein
MPNLMLPLSGNVNQVINPWNWMNRSVGGQFGFINIDMGQSADPSLEQEILDDVGTYGRQIGQLADALQAVLLHLEADKWEGESKKAVDAFQLQLGQVKRLKDKRKAASKP